MKMTILAGDIGGTKTILRLASSEVSDMRPLLEKIPVHVILDPRVALIGAALTAVKEK